MKNLRVTVSSSKKIKIGSDMFVISSEAEIANGEDLYVVSMAVKNSLNQKIEKLTKDRKEKNPLETISISNNVETKTKQEKTPEKELMCPECDEPMYKQKDKDYYLCEFHYGYPDMIKRGEVRKRRFKNKR